MKPKKKAQTDLLNAYQREAWRFNEARSVLALILGLAGEVGSVITVYKKRVRDGRSYNDFDKDLREELGDCLWYLSAVCSIFGVTLEKVINDNLKTTASSKSRTSCKTFADYQKFVVAANKNRKHSHRITLALNGLSKNSANLLETYSQLPKNELELAEARKSILKNIGDIFWYLANLAGYHGLKLEYVAIQNLAKISGRRNKGKISNFDKAYPKDERFPRKFEITFKEKKFGEKPYVKLYLNGVVIGDTLSDNSYAEDHYRYHDVFHLAYLAVLGWSPVIRALLKRKRKSNSITDEVEDGARATILEEAISFLVFSHAKGAKFFVNTEVSDSLIAIIKDMTYDLEVKGCTHTQWKIAIKRGYKIFEQLKQNRGGVVALDLGKGTITYRKK